jgi:hypothetical protein
MSLIFEKNVNVPFKSNKQKNLEKNNFLLPSPRSLMKITGSGSVCQRYGSADPDPFQNATDQQHWFEVGLTRGYLLSLLCVSPVMSNE